MLRPKAWQVLPKISQTPAWFKRSIARLEEGENKIPEKQLSDLLSEDGCECCDFVELMLAILEDGPTIQDEVFMQPFLDGI